MEGLEFLEFERAIGLDIGVHAGDLAVDRTVGKGCRRRANGAIGTGVDDSGRRTGGVEYTASERGIVTVVPLVVTTPVRSSMSAS